MAKLNELATDVTKLESGVWVPHPDLEGVKFLIGSLKSQSYENAARKHMKGKRKTLSKARLRAMTTWESMKLIAPVIAKYVFLGWEGLEDDNGDELQYSHQKALELLTDERYRTMIYDFILEVANDGAEFKLLEDEEDLGNSES